MNTNQDLILQIHNQLFIKCQNELVNLDRIVSFEPLPSNKKHKTQATYYTAYNKQHSCIIDKPILELIHQLNTSKRGRT
jgi:hypothetical protein